LTMAPKNGNRGTIQISFAMSLPFVAAAPLVVALPHRSSSQRWLRGARHGVGGYCQEGSDETIPSFRKSLGKGGLPFQQIDLIDIQAFTPAIEGDDDSQPNGGLRRRHGDDKDGENLPRELVEKA
jgi:hypothetical protein